MDRIIWVRVDIDGTAPEEAKQEKRAEVVESLGSVGCLVERYQIVLQIWAALPEDGSLTPKDIEGLPGVRQVGVCKEQDLNVYEWIDP